MRANNTENYNQNDPLNTAVEEIVNAVKSSLRSEHGSAIDEKWLDKFVRSKNKETHDEKRVVAKRRLMPTYLELKKTPGWARKVGLNDKIDDAITALLKAKPRRTTSGVATISVLTKPWPCSGNCIFCPNDIRMPKSYIHNEPACQRAERWNFDPYMQVLSRLKVLQDMGHNIDKIELIVLGGTFTDYTEEYQTFFIKELFRALNDFREVDVDRVLASYKPKQTTGTVPMVLQELQQRINDGELTYNQAWELAYSESEQQKSNFEKCTLEQLEAEHSRNKMAKHRNVGLVVETRPDRTDAKTLTFLRRLGTTKIQIGLQTLDEEVLSKNSRQISVEDLAKSMDSLRTFGYKSHVHMMANLPFSTIEKDMASYEKLISDQHFEPDEIKIYPCVCVESAQLYTELKEGRWSPYSDGQLRELISKMIAITPAYCRISRVIRDISTCDIIAGNKTPNLRQIIDKKYATNKITAITEIRSREIADADIDPSQLILSIIEYKTSNTSEYFIEWVTKTYALAGFLRLSIPEDNETKSTFLSSNGKNKIEDYSIIREVHIYGKVAKIHAKDTGVQHTGLGKKLIEQAERISKENSCKKMYVISAVGTREYYEKLGFNQDGLYHAKEL